MLKSIPRSDLKFIKPMFMLSSAENEIFLAHKYLNANIFGILTFMSRKNSILGLSELEKAQLLPILLLMSI